MDIKLSKYEQSLLYYALRNAEANITGREKIDGYDKKVLKFVSKLIVKLNAS